MIKRNFKKILITVGFLSVISGASYFGYQAYFNKPIQQEDWSPLSVVPEEIKGKIITLRTLKAEYFEDYHKAWSETVRKALEFPLNIGFDYTTAHLQIQMRKAKEGKTLCYMIFDNKDNKLVGELQIREKNESDPGQFSFWINENYWGKGRSQEGLKLITRTYFRLHPGVNSFTAHCRLWNQRSYHAMKKFGFKDAGLFYENGVATRYMLEYRRP
jgi:RimJ/RimL family protein N-acetyltransferase